MRLRTTSFTRLRTTSLTRLANLIDKTGDNLIDKTGDNLIEKRLGTTSTCLQTMSEIRDNVGDTGQCRRYGTMSLTTVGASLTWVGTMSSTRVWTIYFQKIGTTSITYLGGGIDNLRNIIDKTWDYIKN